MKTFSFLILLLGLNTAFAQSGGLSPEIDSLFRPYDNAQLPGMSVGVVKDGVLIYSKGFGLANIETGAKNDCTTVFGIASVAKQFTAACIWSLIRENKISLDDEIQKFIPEFTFYEKKILIRHMLNHTSGIRNYHAIMDLAGFDYDREYHDNQTILELACRQRALNHPPGEKVIYGNTAYTILAIIIERISGKNLNEYAQEKIFRPLGMMHTFYRTSMVGLDGNAALGYTQNDEGEFVHFENNQLSYGAGSVGSNIEDLAKWSDILNGSNPDYRDLTQFLTETEVLKSGQRAKYARGVMVDEYKGMETVHHSGYSQGGQSQIIAIPDHKLAIIILTNLESIDPTPLSYKVLDLFLPDQKGQQNDPNQDYRYATQELQNFTGQFKEQNSDMQLELLLQNDTLKSIGSQGKRVIALQPVGVGKFVRSNNAGVLYDFADAQKQDADLIVYFGGTPFYFSRAHFIPKDEVILSDYHGVFYSDELDVVYEIYSEGDDLYLKYPHHDKIKLMAGQKDEFGNGQRVLYRFERNAKGEVVMLYLSAQGTLSNIAFKKRGIRD